MRSKHFIVLFLMILSLGACDMTRTVLDDSAVDTYSTSEAELDYWDDVATRRVITNNDALYGLLLVAGETDPGSDFPARLELAQARGWIDAGAQPPPNASATVGMISMAVCEILDIRGGLTLSLAGYTPRYCTRELVFMEILPPRTEFQSITGLEFIDLISRMEDYADQTALADET